MARPLRIQYPGAFYHVTARGNEKKAIYKSKSDRLKFIQYLELSYERYDAVMHAYCLMDNHYHLLLETPQGNLSQIIQYINGSYSSYFNSKHKRAGHLFQGRFKAILVQKDVYAQELSRYIHLNPVRAGLVALPSDYRWSSCPFYAGLKDKPDWLQTDFILGLFGQKKKLAQTSYYNFVQDGLQTNINNPLKETRASTFLGTPDFIKNAIKHMDKQDINDADLPAVRQIETKPSLKEIERTVECVIGKSHPFYSKFSIHVSHRYSGLSLNEIGKYFGKNGSTICQSSRRFKQEIVKNRELKKIMDDMLVELKLR